MGSLQRDKGMPLNMLLKTLRREAVEVLHARRALDVVELNGDDVHLTAGTSLFRVMASRGWLQQEHISPGHQSKDSADQPDVSGAQGLELLDSSGSSCASASTSKWQLWVLTLPACIGSRWSMTMLSVRRVAIWICSCCCLCRVG